MITIHIFIYRLLFYDISYCIQVSSTLSSSSVPICNSKYILVFILLLYVCVDLLDIYAEIHFDTPAVDITFKYVHFI